MRCCTCALAIVGVFFATAPVFASVEGDTISGVLNFGGYTTNFFDPANGYVPAYSSGIQPNAVVTSADGTFVEFEYLNGFAGFHVDVDATTISINEFAVAGGGGANTWDIWLNGLDWLGGPGGITGISKLSDDFGGTGLVSAAWTNDSVHLFVDQYYTLPANGATAVFELQGGAAVPEPAALIIWGLLGSLGVAATLWRKRKAG